MATAKEINERFRAHAKELHRANAARVEEVTRRRDLNDEGRAGHLARERVQLKRELDAARTETQRALDDRREARVTEIMRNPGSWESASNASYRAALDAVEAVRKPEDAMRLLQRARRAGDAHLERAIAARALEKGHVVTGSGWIEVLDAWAGDNQERLGALHEIMDIDELNSDEQRFSRNIFGSAGMPTGQLQGLDAGDIDRLADNAEDYLPRKAVNTQASNNLVR